MNHEVSSWRSGKPPFGHISQTHENDHSWTSNEPRLRTFSDGFMENASESSSSNDSRQDFNSTGSAQSDSTSVTSLDESPCFPSLKTVSAKDDKPNFQQINFDSGSSQDDYLHLLEPLPAFPPCYEDLPPGGCPRFPITDEIHNNEKLPTYSPAAYKIGLCQRKQECLSPYELSPSRSWKTVVMELNSTQLNIYTVSGSLFENSQINSLRTSEATPSAKRYSERNKSILSIVTTERDLVFHRECEKNGLFNSDYFNAQTISDDDPSGPSLFSSSFALKGKSSQTTKLMRSYSLQHAKIGLASDYTKKPNVLRLRLENEQFLVHFLSTKDLIDWNLAFCIGKGVSLDLAEREAPRYRTVPRRRRNTFSTNTPFYNDVVTRRLRAQSDPRNDGNRTRFRGKLSKIKTKITSSSSSTGIVKVNSSQQTPLAHVFGHREKSATSIALGNALRTNHGQIKTDALNFKQAKAVFNLVGDDDDIEGSSESSMYWSLSSSVPCDNNDPDEIEHLSDLRLSDDDEELNSDVEEFNADECSNTQSSQASLPSSSCKWDMKWKPEPKVESKRRYMRNCLKCIRPLGFDDNWVNKSLVKPTSITPLTSYYLKLHFNGHLSSSSSMSSISSIGNTTDCGFLSGTSCHKRKFSSKESLFGQVDNSLSKLPQHHLQEYIVGSHSLIPKGL